MSKWSDDISYDDETRNMTYNVTDVNNRLTQNIVTNSYKKAFNIFIKQIKKYERTLFYLCWRSKREMRCFF